jgi:Phosphate-selective porin
MRSLLCSTAIATILVTCPAPALAQSANSDETEALRAEIRELRARLEALESRIGTAPAANSQVAAAGSEAPAITASAAKAKDEKSAGAKIAWKGSPQISEGDKLFKVKGRLQADANNVSIPDSLGDRAGGFSNEMRRIRLGGEGSLGAGFSYKLELELSDNQVDLVDTFVSYKNGGWLVQLGNQNSFQSLDELTGDTSGAFMERAAFTDAFNFERRLGVSVQYATGPLILQGGAFTDDIGALANSSDGVDGGDENNSYGLDGRVVYAPKIGDIQLHLGASGHWRRLGRLALGSTRYRQRPYAHSINTRLIGTSSLNVDTESHYGVEVAVIKGRWWGAAEWHALTADRIAVPSVTFQGAYAELGYFLTDGDARGYKNGIFATNAPAHPMGDGGIGSIQVALRYDYLDLDDADVRGGQQNGYIAALVWSPIQYLRFNVNYALLQYDGAVALPSGKRDYNAQVVGTRFELDF